MDVSCAYVSALFSFTTPINARHYCLIGQNRFTAPYVRGPCTDESPSEPCTSCVSLGSLPNEENEVTRECNFYYSDTFAEFAAGLAANNDFTPLGDIGYNDQSCPIGYEEYANSTSLSLHCPFDSVMMVDVLSEDNYEFVVSTSKNLILKSSDDPCMCRRSSSNDCLIHSKTGQRCGTSNTHSFFVYHPLSSCQYKNSKMVCENSDYFLGNENCTEMNGLTCEEVHSVLTENNIQNVETAGASLTDDDHCGLESLDSLKNPDALTVGVIFFVLTLLPGLMFSRYEKAGQRFLVGVFSEAFANAFFATTSMAIDWKCLRAGGFINLSDVLLPYVLLGFGGAEILLYFIAVVYNWDKNFVGSDSFSDLETFKWADPEENCTLRLLRSAIILVFGGFGGMMQFVSIVAGVLDSQDNVSGTTYFLFIISSCIGLVAGGFLMSCGLYIFQNVPVGWRVYKFLVSDIPGFAAALEMAPGMTLAWSTQCVNDLIQVMLISRTK